MIGELSLQDAAKEAAGNWLKFSCFVWHRPPDHADQWAIVYTHNRDSGLVDQSNAGAIDKALAPFVGRDVRKENHSHWACGWVEGYAIRVFRRGRITKAFKTYHELARRLAEYPLLDEADYSNREYEATVENIGDAAWRLKDEYDLPKGWQSAVFSWLWDNNDSAVENVDDRGGYPDEGQLRAAFDALGYQQLEAV